MEDMEKITPRGSTKNNNTKDMQQEGSDEFEGNVQEEEDKISFCFDIPTQSSSSSSDGKDSDSDRSASDNNDVGNSASCSNLDFAESCSPCHSQKEQVLKDDLTPILHKSRNLSNHKKKSQKKIIFSQVMSTPCKSVGECGLIDTPDKSATPSGTLLQGQPEADALVDTPLQRKRDGSTSERRVFQNKKKRAKKSESVLLRRKYRQSQYTFLDIEAKATSGDETMHSEDEEYDFKNQSQDSFINDTSQLGYTQDALDLVEDYKDSRQGEDAKGLNLDDKAFHRAIDSKWNQADLFSTPILRRKNIKVDGSTQISQFSIPSSDRGLGKMHFIRSVLEHHKAGGDDEEIEKEYHSILKDNLVEPTQTTIAGNQDARQKAKSPVGNGQLLTLKEEQKLRIKENRRLALLRRAAHQKEKSNFAKDTL